MSSWGPRFFNIYYLTETKTQLREMKINIVLSRETIQFIVHTVTILRVKWGILLTITCGYIMGFPGGSVVKNPPANAGDQGWSLDQEDLPEKEMATHSSILAWEIPETEKPGGLQSVGSQRIGYYWAHTRIYNGQELTCSRQTGRYNLLLLNHIEDPFLWIFLITLSVFFF